MVFFVFFLVVDSSSCGCHKQCGWEKIGKLEKLKNSKRNGKDMLLNWALLINLVW